MGIRDYLPGAGENGDEDRRFHRECRECGRNLETDRERCPTCGGRVATYEL